jgi:hypothetical protein
MPINVFDHSTSGTRLAVFIRGYIQHGPDRCQIARAARVLPGIGRRPVHFAAAKMPDFAIFPRAQVERCVITAISVSA